MINITLTPDQALQLLNHLQDHEDYLMDEWSSTPEEQELIEKLHTLIELIGSAIHIEELLNDPNL